MSPALIGQVATEFRGDDASAQDDPDGEVIATASAQEAGLPGRADEAESRMAETHGSGAASFDTQIPEVSESVHVYSANGVPLANVEVRIEGGGGSFDRRTDEWGRLGLARIPDGRYRATALLHTYRETFKGVVLPSRRKRHVFELQVGSGHSREVVLDATVTVLEASETIALWGRTYKFLLVYESDSGFATTDLDLGETGFPICLEHPTSSGRLTVAGELSKSRVIRFSLEPPPLPEAPLLLEPVVIECDRPEPAIVLDVVQPTWYRIRVESEAGSAVRDAMLVTDLRLLGETHASAWQDHRRWRWRSPGEYIVSDVGGLPDEFWVWSPASGVTAVARAELADGMTITLSTEGCLRLDRAEKLPEIVAEVEVVYETGARTRCRPRSSARSTFIPVLPGQVPVVASGRLVGFNRDGDPHYERPFGVSLPPGALRAPIP